MSCPVPASADADEAAAAPAAPATAATAPVQGDMGFDVNVTLSKKAADKLAADKEGIVVFASYYGDPKKSAEKHANEIGQISVSTTDENVQIPGTGGHAHIGGKKVDAQTLKWVEGGIKVNVNVASARKSGPDNILNCDFIDGALSDVRKAPVTLHCYLIEEKHPDTVQKP